MCDYNQHRDVDANLLMLAALSGQSGAWECAHFTNTVYDAQSLYRWCLTCPFNLCCSDIFMLYNRRSWCPAASPITCMLRIYLQMSGGSGDVTLFSVITSVSDKATHTGGLTMSNRHGCCVFVKYVIFWHLNNSCRCCFWQAFLLAQQHEWTMIFYYVRQCVLASSWPSYAVK